MEHRYGVLRIIATIYKVLGVLVGIATVLGALGICAASALGGAAALNAFGTTQNTAGGIVGGFFGGLAILLVGALYTLTLYALGDGISLLLALEENTRLTASILQQNLRAAALPAAPASNLPVQNP